MKEIINHHQIELAKSILEGAGYKVEKIKNPIDIDVDESRKDYRFKVSCNGGPTKIVNLIWDRNDPDGAKETAKRYYSQEHSTYADDRQNQWKIEESESSSPEFKVGDVVEWTGLYGGSYTGQVKSVEPDIIKMDVSWIAEDTGETVTEEEVYAKTVDSRGNECIIVWEYRGEEGYVYPPTQNTQNESVSSSWDYQEAKERKGPFEYPYYYKEYSNRITGYVYPPYKSNSPYVDSIDKYYTELQDDNAHILDTASFNTLEDAQAHLDTVAADYTPMDEDADTTSTIYTTESKKRIYKLWVAYRVEEKLPTPEYSYNAYTDDTYRDWETILIRNGYMNQ